MSLQTVGLAAPFAVKHLSGDGASLRELAWNPTQAGLMAVCTDGGCLTLLEVMEGVSSRKTLTSIFTSCECTQILFACVCDLPHRGCCCGCDIDGRDKCNIQG